MRFRKYITETYQVGHKKYDSDEEGWYDWSTNEWPKIRNNIKILSKK